MTRSSLSFAPSLWSPCLSNARNVAARCNTPAIPRRVRVTRCAMERPVLLTDVMDTLVRDPFSRGMAQHLGFDSFSDFLASKRDEAWAKFELGRLGEDALSKQFFLDPERNLDVPKFKQFLRDSYALMPGVDELLANIRSVGIKIHAFSNYPIWFTLIEDKLRLERDHGVRWTFVSACEGCRKPDKVAFLRAASNANASVAQCILLDDRQANCDAALEAGFLAAVRFENAEQASRDLQSIFAPYFRNGASSVIPGKSSEAEASK